LNFQQIFTLIFIIRDSVFSAVIGYSQLSLASSYFENFGQPCYAFIFSFQKADKDIDKLSSVVDFICFEYQQMHFGLPKP